MARSDESLLESIGPSASKRRSRTQPIPRSALRRLAWRAAVTLALIALAGAVGAIIPLGLTLLGS